MGFWKKWSSSKIPIWFVGMTVGICFLGIGFCEGQFTDIYRKAIMICLECIGIG